MYYYYNRRYKRKEKRKESLPSNNFKLKIIHGISNDAEVTE